MSVAIADKVKSTVLFYEEIEQGAGSQHVRYIINEQFLRIDDGSDTADYILFDVAEKNIYSVNHDDQTILHIENNEWIQPKFEFNVTTHQSAIKGAPKVHDKIVYSYSVKVEDKECTSVFLIKDMLNKEMKVLYKYQQVLSGQQVATLKNTPKEFQTPCFLVDQVYHMGDYYNIGLPLRIHFNRDYVKLLKDFKQDEFDSVLFELPGSYNKYKAFMN